MAEDDQTPQSVTEKIVADDLRQNVVRRFQLQAVEGPCRGAVCESVTDRSSIGSHAANDLVLDEPTVSRFHCELVTDARGLRVRDLGSQNGVILDGVPVLDAFVRGGSLLRLGRSVVRFQFVAERNQLPISASTRFGSLVGTSVASRMLFGLLERVAASDATVLLEGETGTGKEGAAESLWRAGARRDQPFVVVDCSAIPGNLLESELFGHEKGAFTGAAGRRVGAFEEATGGTIFLDEVGELPVDLQPKLLRVLEARQVRRVGGSATVPVDVRVIAATNRDLRTEVNAGRFRSDLYFRLAVVKIGLPPLRARPEDIPTLVDDILASLEVPAEAAAPLRDPAFIDTLQRAVWPGNVRELRNYLERCVVFQEPLPVSELTSPPPPTVIDASLPFEEVRQRVLADFERRYVAALLETHKGHVASAARAAKIAAGYVYRLMRKYGLRS